LWLEYRRKSGIRGRAPRGQKYRHKTLFWLLIEHLLPLRRGEIGPVLLRSYD
jgi:hypothetical protein